MATTSFLNQVKFTQKNAVYLAEALEKDTKPKLTDVKSVTIRDEKSLKELLVSRMK